jgi:hypothetical protein
MPQPHGGTDPAVPLTSPTTSVVIHASWQHRLLIMQQAILDPLVAYPSFEQEFDNFWQAPVGGTGMISAHTHDERTTNS